MKYSIYDWFEDLKSMQWDDNNTNSNELRKWTNHFLGDGYYDQINNKVISLFDSLNKVDFDYLTDRMYSIWDELPSSKSKYIYSAISHSDFKNRGNLPNGLIVFSDLKKTKTITIHIIKEIVYYISYIGLPSVKLRTTDDQVYVLDKKWNFKNFNINDFDIKEGDEVKNGKYTTYITKCDISDKLDLSIQRVLNLYEPCITMDIGGYDSYKTGKFSISKLEEMLDDTLPSILPYLNYKKIIWDRSRFERRFNDDDSYDYTLKIILN